MIIKYLHMKNILMKFQAPLSTSTFGFRVYSKRIVGNFRFSLRREWYFQISESSIVKDCHANTHTKIVAQIEDQKLPRTCKRPPIWGSRNDINRSLVSVLELSITTWKQTCDKQLTLASIWRGDPQIWRAALADHVIDKLFPGQTFITSEL